MWLGKREYRTALAWQVGLAGYMQLVSWVPLGSWNYQPCCPTGLELLSRGTLSGSDVVGTVAWTWWPPYLLGASDHWSQVYARAFAHSTPILPRWGNHLPPDAMHFVLQVLLSGSVATGTMAVLRQPLRTRSNTPLQPPSGA